MTAYTPAAQIPRATLLTRPPLQTARDNATRPAGEPTGIALQYALARPGTASPSDLLSIQRHFGNRAAQHLIQRKLAVGPVGDTFEQEADQVADHVMRMPAVKPSFAARGKTPSAEEGTPSGLNASPSITPTLARAVQRACACGGQHSEEEGECEACRQKREAGLQRQSTGEAAVDEAPPIVHQVIGSSGQALDTGARTMLEPRFGYDFSQVRVHTGAQAAESARAVQALAYTVGNDVVFGAGQYAPGTSAGQHLLAHELTHVIQQGSASPALQSKLPIGSVADPAETEADQLADQVLGGVSPSRPTVARTPWVLRRTPDGPQRVGETRQAIIPAPDRGEGAHYHIRRILYSCACAKVPETRSGAFYNPDLDNLTIAYRHCRGGRTTDIYGQLESNATAFLTGSAPPSGTATVGIDVNVVGRKVSGRVIVEAVGSNTEGREGIGGRAQVVFQGGKWRVFVTSDYLHRLGAASGDQLDLRLGAELGPVKAEVTVNDVLGKPSARGTACVPLFGGKDLCLFVEGDTGGITFRQDFDLGGPKARPEECYQCLCPPPVRKYECILDIPPRDVETSRDIDVERNQEFRYYFRLDRTKPSEDSTLAAQSGVNLRALASYVGDGTRGRILTIFGYASPEAPERTHNQDLSKRRAEHMRDLVAAQVGARVTLPEPNGGGELLGTRPAASPSSRLGDLIHAGGFRSAEDLSVLLLGEEIPRAELAEQFISLFSKLTTPEDRLAVFGLTPADSIAAHVLAAVESFVRSGGRGHRPWEGIFRPLRVAVVRAARTETERITETSRTDDSVTKLSEIACQSLAQMAEIAGEFGPIDPSALKPTNSPSDRDTFCAHEPDRREIAQGCNYEIPPALRGRVTAPERAPRPLE